MSAVQKHYLRVLVVWIVTLSALYWLQRHFNAF
jgi:hypothetical protein